MANQSSIYLTRQEAIAAICIDFRQYDPQILLFAEVLPLLTKGQIHLKRDPGKEGAWINRSGKPSMQWMDGGELIDFMCDAVSKAPWTAELLASVGQRVFQSRVRPVLRPETGDFGIQVETNMAEFHCRQCGHCCRSLDYHQELTEADVALWRAQGRTDVLDWVETASVDGTAPVYRIWVSPKTGRIASTCPFLHKEDTSNRWFCGIHEIKPGICRQYPVSRKHAIMTGCPGFQRTSSKK